MIAVPIIVSALKKELGSYFSTEAHKDNDVVRYINSAARAICISRNFDFNNYKITIIVTDGITEYSIPYQIETFFVKKNGVEIDFMDFINYNKLDDKSEIIGIWGDKLECSTPGSYEIFYRGYPEQITSLNDSLNIPSHFYDLIVLKATYFGFMDIRSYSTANNKETIFKGMISDMASRSSNPRPLQIKRLNKSKSKAW